ncbi:asparagine synthase-related protein [Amycolatopsis benzoatilytica]|uniref:asparagine synthase-related protein n=1 Tax=Amycolatopsis benzoatilytica TaxID=346045 RepID=UPI001FDF27FF|nr:asparagine synthase-related protein [Amycolatopsis benzoatilytica]
MLLDCKDQISMAVGLEVRVPYGDHRLMEYVYNVPWAEAVLRAREEPSPRGCGRPAARFGAGPREEPFSVRKASADIPDSTRAALDRTIDITRWLEGHQPETDVG